MSAYRQIDGLAVLDRGYELSGGVHGYKVGGLTWSQAVGSTCEAGHGGRVDSEQAEGLIERCAGEGNEIGERAVEGEQAARPGRCPWWLCRWRPGR